MSYNTQVWNQVRPGTSLARTRKKIVVPAFTTLCAENNNAALAVKYNSFLHNSGTGAADFSGLSSVFGVGPFQVDCWVKPGPTITGSQETCYVLSRSFSSSGSNVAWQIKILKTGEVVFVTRTSGGVVRTKTSVAKVVRNDWNHIGVQWSQTGSVETFVIYVNGVKFIETPASIVTSLNTSSNVYVIGLYDSSGVDTLPAPFDLDELRFWSIHKDANYFSGLIPNFKRSVDEAGLECYWKFSSFVDESTALAFNVTSAAPATVTATGYPNVLSAMSFAVAKMYLSGLTKNFSLKFPIDLGDVNYSLTVAWTDADGVFYRRLLHEGHNLVTYTPIIPYNGETINYANGYLEIWNDMLETTIVCAGFTLETSILQAVTDLIGTVLANNLSLAVDTGLWTTLPTLPYTFNQSNQDTI